MKTLTTRIISLVLAVAVFLLCSPPTVFASGFTKSIPEAETILEIGDTRIDSFATADGDTVLLQYVNNELTQANVIKEDNTDIVFRYTYDSSLDQWTEINNLSTPNFVTVSNEPDVSTYATVTGFRIFGYIYYTVQEDSGINSYCQKVEYSTREKISTYKVNAFRGAVVDLVSLLVGAIQVPTKFIGQYVDDLLRALGITVVAGVISEFFSPSLACTQTTYTWRLTILETGASITNVTGDMYYITHEDTPHTNRTYYEKYTPQDWGTSLMAQTFFCQQFMSLYWSVDRWIRVQL